MKLRKWLRNKPYVKPIVLGFLGIYVVAMFAITCYEYEKYSEEIFKMVTNTAISIEEVLGDKNEWLKDEIPWEQKNFLKAVVSGAGANALDKYSLMSSAIYDQKGNLIAESENIVGNSYLSEESGKIHYYYYSLADYFSEEEIEELAKYRWENYKIGLETDDIWECAPRYHIPIKIEERTGELAAISVLETKWEDTGKSDEELAELVEDEENHYWGPKKLVEEKSVWEWKNPDVTEDAKTLEIADYTMGFRFPGLNYGLGNWKKWQETEMLHDFPQTINGVHHYSYKTHILYDPSSEESFTLMINFVTKPWLAAMDSAKLICLFSLLFVAFCAVVVLYFMEKVYKKQAVLEETRRDFTNAIAHELKTPLGVIRGFSENLAENTVEDKREYYLRQIIGQTEVMDDLVQEMIYVSKLDSENLVLKKEDLSFFELIESQLQKLEPAIKEKNLQIDYKLQGDFTFSGDKHYLEKAVWNLLSNACEYNWIDGKIQIAIGNSWCIIENTGNPISSEDLPHVCDMFYSSDKSRTSNKKHMGMGLYLAKKIFTLHRLNFTIENSSIGVKVIITK